MIEVEKNTCVIRLNSIEKVKDFVNRVSIFDCDIDIIYGRYVIDGTSIMGIFSLDLTNPVTAMIHTDDYEELKRFFEMMEDFK